MKIFLSHSSSDKKRVREVSDRLKREGLGVWIDECQINFGDSLVKKISESIESVNYVLAFLSKASVLSDWVKFELELASTGEITGKRLIVIPILIEPCEIPPYLRHKLYCDLSDRKAYSMNMDNLLDQLKGKVRLQENVDLKYDEPDKSLDGIGPGIVGAIALLMFVFRSDLPNGNTLFNYSAMWFVLSLGGRYADVATRRVLLECRKTIPNFGRAVSTYQLYGILRPSYLVTILTFFKFQLVKIYLIFLILGLVILCWHFYFAWKLLSLASAML